MSLARQVHGLVPVEQLLPGLPDSGLVLFRGGGLRLLRSAQGRSGLDRRAVEVLGFAGIAVVFLGSLTALRMIRTNRMPG